MVGAAYAIAGWYLIPQLFRRTPLRRLIGPFPPPLALGDTRSSDVYARAHE